MSLFQKLFGGKQPLSEQEQRKLAASLIEEADALALTNPDKAIALLGSKGKPAYELLRIGGAMHREFRSLVEKTWARQAPCALLDSSAVEVDCWDTWEYPTVGDLINRAESAAADVLYLAPPPKRNPRNAVAELEALRWLKDPQIAMVTVGAEGMFLRCSFVLGAREHVKADSEDIGQDMIDLAKAQDLKVAVVVA